MIRWTTAGAVSEPETLQIRVAPAYDGRVEAGAPEPSRSMRPDEVEANLVHFTEGRRGPRTSPCTVLVLGGIGGVVGLEPVVERARELGVGRVVLHLGTPDPRLAASELAGAADHLVARIHTEEEAARLKGFGHRTDAVVLLDEATVARLPTVVEALIRVRPRRVVLTWPLSGAAVPSAIDAAAAVRPILRRLDEVEITAGVKGIPLCTLAPGPAPLEPWAHRVWRSANRFYVDADHQLGDALIFFPDVVRFAKADSCRFCAAVGRCDGVVETWLRRGLAGPLVPLG